MITMIPTKAPADLLGQGGIDVRPVHGPGLCAGVAERAVAPIAAFTAPSRGTGLPAGSTAVRLRPVTRQAIAVVVTSGSFQNSTTFENNGTTLGSHSSRRPQS